MLSGRWITDIDIIVARFFVRVRAKLFCTLVDLVKISIGVQGLCFLGLS